MVGEGARHTASPQTDVYAFGMLAYEIFDGNRPEMKLKSGKYASIPDHPSATAETNGLTRSGELWKLLKRCWISDPAERPFMKEVAEKLRSMLRERSGTFHFP